MDDATAKLVGAIIAFAVLFGIPLYNFFAERAREKKADTDQLHARINDQVIKTAYQEGYRQGGIDKLQELAVIKTLFGE